MDDEVVAGRRLRDLRRGAALTQDQLARRAGVSIRTIRDLENGRIRAPHLTTLALLAEAMGLDGDATDAVIRTWSDDAPRTLFADLRHDEGVDVLELLRSATLRNDADKRFRQVTISSVVGPGRRLTHHDYDLVLEAIADGVDSTLLVQRSDQAADVRFYDIVETVGCRLRDRVWFAEHGLVAFEIDLGAPARAGETRAIGFRVLLEPREVPTDPADRAAWEALTDSDGVSFGPRRPMRSFTQRVRFDGCRPTRVWQTRGDRYEHEVAELEPDEFGVVHVHGSDLPADTYGILWSF